jgi:hypothetical protein
VCYWRSQSEPAVPGTRMPSSAVQTFTDPDDYATSIRATRAELTVMGRGHFTAKLIRIDLHQLWMQRFFDNPSTAYQYDWNMLPVGQQLWLEWFETLRAFPPMQAPERYNLSQAMDQIKAAGHSSD